MIGGFVRRFFFFALALGLVLPGAGRSLVARDDLMGTVRVATANIRFAGDTVLGRVRPPKNGERYLALLKVEEVNLGDPEEAKHRIAFDNLRPRYPESRIQLENEEGDISMRIMDLVAPIGMGHG